MVEAPIIDENKLSVLEQDTVAYLGDVSLTDLFQKHQGFIATILLNKYIPHCDLEDELQNFFIHAFRGAHTYRAKDATNENASPLTWMANRIMRTTLGRRGESKSLKAAKLEVPIENFRRTDDDSESDEDLYSIVNAKLESYQYNPEMAYAFKQFEQACYAAFTPQEAALVDELGLDNLDVTAKECKNAARACGVQLNKAKETLLSATKKVAGLLSDHFD